MKYKFTGIDDSELYLSDKQAKELLEEASLEQQENNTVWVDD